MEQTLAARQITEGVIWKQLLRFFFPILLGSFFQQMYNTVDTIIVGRAVGTQALAAVGSTSALINLINGFFIGLSTGATVILSQFYGAGDRQGVEKALHTGISLSLVLGLLTASVGVLAGPAILKAARTPENCLADASVYVRIYFSGAIASMVYNMGTGILRAMGDSRKPTIFLIIACFINIIMDIMLVVVLKMGVAGAALATVISQAISAVLVLLCLFRQPEESRLYRNKLQLNGHLLRRILLIGLPAGLQFITFDLANLMLQSGINSFGDVTVAAWTAFVKTDTIIWLVTGAFGVAITTFVGQNFGAQKYGRIRQSVRTCMVMGIASVGLLSAVELIFRVPILSIYTADPEVIRMGAYAMLWIVPLNFLFIPVEVFSGTMRGTGYSVVPTIITCITACVFRVLWLWLIVSRWHTIEVLAICYPVSWLVSTITFTVVYLRGNWLKKRIEECGMEPEVR